MDTISVARTWWLRGSSSTSRGRDTLGRFFVRAAGGDPPEQSLRKMREYTLKLARALKVIGLMNIQFAIRNNKIFVLEVNPRASRTVPYVSKATGIPLAKIAARRCRSKLREFLPEILRRLRTSIRATATS